MESKRFREIKPGKFFHDERMAICVKTLNVQCFTPEAVDGIVYDAGFNAIELDNGRYYKRSFRGNDLVTVVDVDEDLEFLINKVGWD